MAYFNYHAKVKNLIKDGKLVKYRFVKEYHGISPALLLFFDDVKHPIMPIRKERFSEYEALISDYLPFFNKPFD